MSNDVKEEELRQTMDPKYFHLNEELHVEITAFAPAPEAYIRMGNALHEVKRFLVPVCIELTDILVSILWKCCLLCLGLLR